MQSRLVTEITRRPTVQMDWIRPVLRRLPIAATANASKDGTHHFNDGQGGGKGEVAGNSSIS